MQGFVILFFSIIVIAIVGAYSTCNYSFSSSILFGIANATLTKCNLAADYSPWEHIVFSLVTTQLSGLLIITFMLWACWQIFGNESEKQYSFVTAAKGSVLATLIIESALVVFFLYGLSSGLIESDFKQKLLTAIWLSVNSFNNGGFAGIEKLVPLEVLKIDFLLQVGIIGGAALGNLSVFVLKELFSPTELRKRLANPAIDWTFITKVTMFGSGFCLAAGTVVVLFSTDLNIAEHTGLIDKLGLAAFEVSAARGTGISLVEIPYSINLFLNTISLFGTGPFSAGGGGSLLIIIGLWSLTVNSQSRSDHLKKCLFISMYWFIIAAVSLLIYWALGWVGSESSSLSSFARAFASIEITMNGNELISFQKGVTMLLGRLSFILATMIFIIKQKKDASGTF